ncbi:MAG: c-type cytochrome domain-containing protein [Acidobacteriota bacterium]
MSVRYLAFCLGLSWSALGDPGEDFFETKIRPVLVRQCLSCHSGELKSPFGGLRLDSREAMRKGGDSGPAVVAGKPEKSLLLHALNGTNRRVLMPPTGKPAPEVIADFRHWIEIGAPDPRTGSVGAAETNVAAPLWSFRPPRPKAAPAVRDASWPRGELDHFVLARLEEKICHRPRRSTGGHFCATSSLTCMACRRRPPRSTST